MSMAKKKAKKRAAKAKKPVKKVKKASPKKQPVKKSAKKVSPKLKVLKKCKPCLAFVLSDGKQLRSLVHLIDELENMPDDVFNHHVNEFKNDFSSWIRNVFKDEVLADELQLVNDRVETQRTLLKHTVRSLIEVKK